jgi:hypothetical protein
VQLTISMGAVFATPAALSAALIRVFLATMKIERDAKMKRVSDAATTAAMNEAHLAALASARAEGPRGGAAADADMTSGGYARSAAEGHSVPSAIITAIMASCLWELMKQAAASQQRVDLHALISPPDVSLHDEAAAFTLLAGHIYMAISFGSNGITGKSSSAEERTFYKIISSLQGAMPRGLFSVLESACRPLARAGRRVFFPGAIAWFRKSFLILEIGGEKTTSIIDNLHHFSPHSRKFLLASSFLKKLRIMWQYELSAIKQKKLRTTSCEFTTPMRAQPNSQTKHFTRKAPNLVKVQSPRHSMRSTNTAK